MDKETIDDLIKVTEVKQVNAQQEGRRADYSYYGKLLDLLNNN